MVNLIEKKIWIEEFKNCLDKDEFLKVNLKEGKKFDTSFFRNNEFFDLFGNKKEKFFEVDLENEIEIEGFGIVNILIKSDLNLNLKIKKDSCIFLRIILEKGANVNLSENISNSSHYKFMQVYLKKNSKLNFGQIILNSFFNYNQIFLDENSFYELRSAFFCEKISSFFRHESIHLEDNSNSNLQIKGAVFDLGRVICDGLVRVEKNSKNCEGFLQIKGLLLDDTSRILPEPILEIENNNVKCSHSCSVSQVSEDILFYMNSKGISKEKVIELIINGFFEEVKNFINVKEEVILNWKKKN